MDSAEHDPALLARALREMLAILARIDASLEAHALGPVFNVDTDSVHNMITPESAGSEAAGLMWFAVKTLHAIGDKSHPEAGAVASPSRSVPSTLERPVQIPPGSREEIIRFVRHRVQDYGATISGDWVRKLGLEPEDLDRLILGKRIKDPDLRALVKRLENIHRSLFYLNRFLTDYATFAAELPVHSQASYRQYLAKLSESRPSASRAANNDADASNLAQTSLMRSHGYDARLVTHTRVVAAADENITQDPFAFAFEATIRRYLSDLGAAAAHARLHDFINAVNLAVAGVDNYCTLLRAPDQSRPRLREQQEAIASALRLLDENPAISILLNLMSDAATAARNARDHFRRAPRRSVELGRFASLRAEISSLSRRVGQLPQIQWRTSRLSGDHMTYSLLDGDQCILLAAENYGDELAIAWDTNLSWKEYCSLLPEYTRGTHAGKIAVVIRCEGRSEPLEFTVPSIQELANAVIRRTRRTKFSLMKIVSDEEAFWYDSSTLHSFANPDEVDAQMSSKIAVGVRKVERLDALVHLYIVSAAQPLPEAQARRCFERLLKSRKFNG
jgi:hypothetical protein